MRRAQLLLASARQTHPPPPTKKKKNSPYSLLVRIVTVKVSLAMGQFLQAWDLVASFPVILTYMFVVPLGMMIVHRNGKIGRACNTLYMQTDYKNYKRKSGNKSECFLNLSAFSPINSTCLDIP